MMSSLPVSNNDILQIITDYLQNKPVKKRKIFITNSNLKFLNDGYLNSLFIELINKKKIIIPDNPLRILNNYSAVNFSRQLIFENTLEELLLHKFRIIIYKGPATAHLLYPKPHLRPYKDIDLIIHPNEVEILKEHIKDIGYSTFENIFIYKNWHSFHIYPSSPNKPMLDIHTNLAPPYRYNINMDTLFNHTMKLKTLPLPILQPEMHLLSLICHASIDQYIINKINWIDIFLNTNYPGLNWNLILNTADDLGILKALKIALSLCERKLNVKLRTPLWLDPLYIDQLYHLTEYYHKVRSSLQFNLLRTAIFLLSNEEENSLKNLIIIKDKLKKHIIASDLSN